MTKVSDLRVQGDDHAQDRRTAGTVTFKVAGPRQGRAPPEDQQGLPDPLIVAAIPRPARPAARPHPTPPSHTVPVPPGTIVALSRLAYRDYGGHSHSRMRVVYPMLLRRPHAPFLGPRPMAAVLALVLAGGLLPVATLAAAPRPTAPPRSARPCTTRRPSRTRTTASRSSRAAASPCRSARRTGDRGSSTAAGPARSPPDRVRPGPARRSERPESGRASDRPGPRRPDRRSRHDHRGRSRHLVVRRRPGHDRARGGGRSRSPPARGLRLPARTGS